MQKKFINEDLPNMYEGNFIEDGYIIIRNAISENTYNKAQNSVIHTLISLCNSIGLDFSSFSTTNNKIFNELITLLTQEHKPYDILKPVWKNLVHEEIIHSIFNEKRVFNFISNLLGKDLCYQDDPSLTLNIPGVSNSSQNYLFKGFHQEVWSGADIHTVQFWTPLFQADPSDGIALMKSSHLWGHIPHKNREPIHIPNNAVEISSDLAVGDVIFFHTLLLHRSSVINKNGFPRLAIPCLLKNFRTPNHSFEAYRNWKIFSYSDLSQIDRRLGNHYLSPFRLIDLDNKNQTFDGGIK